MTTLSRKTISLGAVTTKEGKGLIHLLCEGNISKLKSKLSSARGLPHPKTALNQLAKKDHGATLATLVNAGCDINEPYLHKSPIEIFISTYEYELTKDRRSFFFGKSEPKEFDHRLLASLLVNGATVSDHVYRGIVHIALSLLAERSPRHDDMSESHLTAQSLDRYTPLGVFRHSDEATRTALGKEIIHYLGARDSKLLMSFLTGYLELVGNKVSCGDILLAFLLQQFKRWEKDPVLFHSMSSSVTSSVNKVARALLADPFVHLKGIVDPYTNMTPLHMSAVLGFESIVAALISKPNIDLNAGDHMGNTALACALRTVCKHKTWQQTNFAAYLGIISALMEHPRIDLGKKDSTGFSALVWCILIMTSMSQQYREIGSYKLLMEARGSVKIQPGTERTPLMMCVVANLSSVLQLLLSDRARGVELKRQDNAGMTALHLAGKHARLDCIEALLDLDPTVTNIQDKLGNTALFYVIEKLGADNTIHLVHKYKTWDLSIRNIYSQNVFYYYKDCVKLKKIPENKNLELMLMKGVQDSVGGRDWRMPSTLSPSANVTTGSLRDVSWKPQDSWGKKMAQAMSESGATHSRKRRTMRQLGSPMDSLDSDDTITITEHIRNLERLRALFQSFCLKTSSHADIDLQISGGHTTAMMCAMEGFAEDLKFIIQNCNPNLNLWDHDDKTALHHASYNGHAACVNILLDATDNINAVDSDGNSSLFYIVERFPYGYAANKLHRHPWDFQITNYLGQKVYKYYKDNCDATVRNEKLASLLESACGGKGLRNSTIFTLQAEVLVESGVLQRGDNNRHSMHAFSSDTLDSDGGIIGFGGGDSGGGGSSGSSNNGVGGRSNATTMLASNPNISAGSPGMMYTLEDTLGLTPGLHHIPDVVDGQQYNHMAMTKTKKSPNEITQM